MKSNNEQFKLHIKEELDAFNVEKAFPNKMTQDDVIKMLTDLKINNSVEYKTEKKAKIINFRNTSAIAAAVVVLLVTGVLMRNSSIFDSPENSAFNPDNTKVYATDVEGEGETTLSNNADNDENNGSLGNVVSGNNNGSGNKNTNANNKNENKTENNKNNNEATTRKTFVSFFKDLFSKNDKDDKATTTANKKPVNTTKPQNTTNGNTTKPNISQNQERPGVTTTTKENGSGSLVTDNSSTRPGTTEPPTEPTTRPTTRPVESTTQQNEGHGTNKVPEDKKNVNLFQLQGDSKDERPLIIPFESGNKNFALLVWSGNYEGGYIGAEAGIYIDKEGYKSYSFVENNLGYVLKVTLFEDGKRVDSSKSDTDNWGSCYCRSDGKSSLTAKVEITLKSSEEINSLKESLKGFNEVSEVKAENAKTYSVNGNTVSIVC